MTDPSTASPDDLELASAYLDGEISAEERARVDQDPRLRALAAELDRARTRLRLDDPPAALADEHVAAALAAGGNPASPRTVADLGAERRRQRWSERLPLGAVAAVILLVALVGALSVADLSSDDDNAETAADSATDDEAASSDAASGAAETSTTAASTFDAAEEAAPAPAARLHFATYDELADHVASTVLAPSPDATGGAGADGSGDAPREEAGEEGTTSDDDSECDPVAAAGVDDPVASVDATVDDREVTALVVEDAGSRRLVVVDRATCAVVDERPLPD